MFIPYHAEVAVERFPTSNLIIMGFTARTYLLVLTGLTQAEFFFLDGINSSLISHGFMHGSLSHLIGNMFYLWLFGNAICSRVNNPSYPAIYILLIIVAGLTHLIYDGDPAIGASGAVNGVMGMYLFLYPASKIKCVWTFPYAFGKTFSVSAFWLIGFWLLKDIYGALFSTAPIAYSAHLGGFFGGLFIGWLLLKNRWIDTYNDEPDLCRILDRHNILN